MIAGTSWQVFLLNGKLRVQNEIQISIDGVDEESNSIVRGKGNFCSAVNTALSFANFGIKTSVSTTPTTDTIYILNQLCHPFSRIRAIEKGKVTQLIHYTYIDVIDKKYRFFAESLLNESNGNIYLRLGEKLLAGRNVNMLHSEDLKHYELLTRRISNNVYPDYAIKDFAIGHEPNQGLKNCGFGSFSIRADGDIYLCNRVFELSPIGNVRKDSLASLLPFVKRIYEKTSVDNISPCKDCNLRYICNGGCRIDDFNFKGNHNLISDEFRIDQINCSEENKDRLYEKMVATIEYLYEF